MLRRGKIKTCSCSITTHNTSSLSHHLTQKTVEKIHVSNGLENVVKKTKIFYFLMKIILNLNKKRNFIQSLQLKKKIKKGAIVTADA
jgi:hypothetical protein